MDRVLGRTTVLGGERDGKYPHGNSLLVSGSEETVLIDPSLSLLRRAEPWGWKPYHEGRWLQHPDLGWVWVPGPKGGTPPTGRVSNRSTR